MSHVFLVCLCLGIVVSEATSYCMVTLLYYLVFLPTRKSFHLSSQIHQRTGFISAATY